MKIERRITDLIAGFSPWLTPLPSAYLIGRASMIHLAWPWPMAIIAALIIEALGLAATSTALDLWDYNQSRRKSDPHAPFVLAASLVGVYVLVAVTLMVLLDVQPGWAAYAPIIFPCLSLTGVAILALRAAHRRRLDAVAADKAERKAERKAIQEIGRKASSVKQSQVSTRPASIDTLQRLDNLLDIYAATPDASPTRAARQLGVSRQTVYTYLEQLEQKGRIRKNGNGIEVIHEQR